MLSLILISIISSILFGYLIMILVGGGPEGGYESTYWGFVFATLLLLIISGSCFVAGIYKIGQSRRVNK